jgi:ABC-type transporter Mla subunit MlaD
LKIEAIQADTTAAIEAIGKISETIQQIKDISNSIATAIEEQLAASGEIGRNLSEAARGSAEISSGIVKVAEIAKDTAGSSENTQKAAEELARLAAELRQLTLKFRFADGAPGDALAGAEPIPAQVDSPFASIVGSIRPAPPVGRRPAAVESDHRRRSAG